MAAKKKTTDEVPEPAAPEPEPTPRPKEKLVAVVALEWFSDGNLKEFMEQYGYTFPWSAGETRSLPGWLIQRCINSGGEFEKADG